MTVSESTLSSSEQPADVPAEPQERVGRLFLTLFGLMNFGLMLTVMMPALFSLPYKIGVFAPDAKVALLGGVATIGAVAGLLTGPIAGVLSDRTRSRLGRRRPWLIGGLLILAAGSTITALANSLPVLIVGWVIVCIGGSANSAGISPIVAERVPESQRGTVGAIVGVATQLAGVLGYTIGGLFTTNLLVLFLIPVGVLAVFGTAFMIAVPEKTPELPRTSLAGTFRTLAFNPVRYPDFSLVWLGKLLMQTALTFLSTFQLYFVIDRLGFTAQEAGGKLALVGGIGILVTMTFAIASGILSDRVQRRKPFIYAASALTAVGLALMAFADGFGLFIAAVMFVLGAAGMFGSIDVAMASDLVPDRSQAGRWMTIYNLAATLSTGLAPVLGSALMGTGSASSGNYTVLFLGGAVVAVGTGIATSFVRGVR